MKKIASLLLALCLALSVTVSMATLTDETFMPDSPSFKVETNSTDSQAKTGDTWYWGCLKDGIISTAENKVTETYAIYAIYPAKNQSAWINADLGTDCQFSGVRLYGRLGWAAQCVTKGYIYVSDDGVDWMRSDLQTFDKNARYADFKTIFGGKEMNVNARYVKVEAVQTGGADSQIHWGMEEFELINPKSGATTKNAYDLKEFKVDETKTDDTSASGTSGSSSSDGMVDISSASIKIETDSTLSEAKVGNEWYWGCLKDGVVSTEDNKVTETFAVHSIRPGNNESAWITIDLGEEKTFSAARLYGRLGWQAQCVTKGYVYVSDDGVDWMRSDAQTFDKTARYADFKMIYGGKQMNVTARYVKIEAIQVGGSDSNMHWGMEEVQLLSSASGAQSANVSSLSKYKAEGKAPAIKDEAESATNESGKYPLLANKSAWQISVSSQISEWNGAKALIDDNKDTFWHSYYEATDGQVTYREPGPYEINITFPEKTVISGMLYQPRKSNGGAFTCVEIYVSDSDSGELELLTTANMNADNTLKTIEFYANITVKRIMLKVVESTNGVGTGAELDFMAKREGLVDSTIKGYPEIEAENKLYPIDTTYFIAKSDVPVWAGHEAASMLDGGINSFWQTEETTFPINFDIDMRTEQEIVKIEMVPRQSSDFHGNWKSFEIWAGNSADDFVKVYEETDSPRSLDAKVVEFEKPLTAKYLRFSITSAHVLNRASMAELYFYQTKSAMDKAASQNYEKYVLKVDDKKMTVTKGSETYEKELDVAPYIYPGKGTTLIPLRGLIEEMGGEIEWIDETQEININAPTGRIEMQVQKKTVYSEHPNYGMIRYTLTVAPKIKDSRTFIPLRFVSEHMGYEVTWNGDTREITIEKK